MMAVNYRDQLLPCVCTCQVATSLGVCRMASGWRHTCRKMMASWCSSTWCWRQSLG